MKLSKIQQRRAHLDLSLIAIYLGAAGTISAATFKRQAAGRPDTSATGGAPRLRRSQATGKAGSA
eukprot:4247828-Alexandrium_andersonii.AAC.1